MEIILSVLLASALLTVLFFAIKNLRIKKTVRMLAHLSSKRGLGGEVNLIKMSAFDSDIDRLAAEINRIFIDYNVVLAETKSVMQQHNELIADISHDMRTPLTSIIGNLELLCGTELDEVQSEYARTASRRAGQLQSLLSDFFELSLIDSGVIQPQIETVNLTDIIGDCMVDNYDAFTSKGITPVFQTSDKPMYITGDVHMLKRVIQNLLDNSIKYSTGDVIIAAQENTVPCLTIKNPVSLIEKIDTDRLFDRFYSQDKARTNGSAGLGLTIVERFLHLMGASVAASKDGSVLVFTIKFQPSKEDGYGGKV